MRTLKASLKMNKNGKLVCSEHQTYKVLRRPTSGCKICWVLYENRQKQDVIDQLDEALRSVAK